MNKSIGRRFKDIIWYILSKVGIGGPLQLMLIGELKENGWYRSFREKKSIDKNGNPIPWNTYPFIRFIEPRLKSNFNVFEYGCGGSTLWYAKRVGSIKSVEHDKYWFDIISKNPPSNSKIVLKMLIEDYINEILRDDSKYHIIIIDGIERNLCIKKSIEKLSADGVLILDNSGRQEYAEGVEFLLSMKFKKIDFESIGPIVPISTSTTIFYKENNCLSI